MELIDVILSKGNLNRAYKKVVANKGASTESIHSKRQWKATSVGNPYSIG